MTTVRIDHEPTPQPKRPESKEPANEWWRVFLDVDDVVRRRQIVAAAMKARIRKPAKAGDRKAMRIETDLLEIAWAVGRTENPIDALAEVESRLQEYARRAGIELTPREPELEAFLASDEPARYRAEFERKLTEEKLLSWLAEGEETAAGERVFLDVVVDKKRALGELPRLAVSVLLSGEREQRVPLAYDDVVALDEDVKGRHRQLRAVERQFVEWLVGRGAVRELQTADRDPTVFFVRDPSERLAALANENLVEWRDGPKLVFAAAPARLGLKRSSVAPPTWAIVFPAFPPDEEEAISLGEVDLVIAGDTSKDAPAIFARRRSALYRVEAQGMPLDLFSLLARCPELPLERLRNNPAGAQLLRRLGPALGREIEQSFTRTVAVRPVVELRLENETTFSVALWARAAGGEDLVRTHSGAWVPRSARAASAEEPRAFEEVLLPVYAETGGDDEGFDPAESAPPSPLAITITPRDEDVRAVTDWVTALVPRHATPGSTDGGVPCFTWKADAASTLRVVREWIKKPAGVAYLGDTAFRSLVKVQEPPKVNVSVERTSIDWLQISVELEEELAMLSIAEIDEALESSDDDILMVHGARLYKRDELEGYKRQIEALHEAGLSLKSGKRQLHVLELTGDAGKALAELGGQEAVEQATTAARARLGEFTGIPHAPVDEPAAGYLRPYQRTGVNFLSFSAHTFGGALLADDMGLGKTLQTLSTITALRNLHEGPKLPSLVICPASVAHNWRREAERFCPHIKAVVVEGPERKAILPKLHEYDLVIENFALIRRDVEVLEAQEFLVVAIDEAQSIKNPGADTTKCVKRLRSKFRIALTGTPIENRLTDLWSITDWLAPGYLGSLSAFERHVREEEAEVLHKMLRARMKPLLLRRVKRDVAPELPERIEERRDCEMTEAQKYAYLAEVKRTRQLLKGADDPSEWNGERRIQMLAALTRLRQICCEPTLCELPDRGSGKLEELGTLLPEMLEAGNKVLLFSQFVRMLDLLEAHLTKLGIPFRTLTGQTPDRMQVVDAFEKDPTPSVFLLSLKAAGTGLNLTSASNVILYDPWWSPALEAQAIDRSHRIGQKKTVVAVRMVTKGTIEERILELQERKRAMARGILEAAGSVDTMLTPEDFEFLLRDPE